MDARLPRIATDVKPHNEEDDGGNQAVLDDDGV